MDTVSDRSFYYNVGGSLGKEAPSYVVRKADQAFYNSIKAGSFSYVFDSRQMGKSSLRVRTMQRFQTEGTACAIIDVSSISSYRITSAEWYLGIIRRLSRSFSLQINVLQWWNQNEALEPVQRLNSFFETVLLEEVFTNIIIFIDEIDSILHLKMKDEFFNLINSFYKRREKEPGFRRLTFALLGVTTLSDLLEGRNQELLRASKAIRLETFSLDEIKHLSAGFRGKADRPLELLKNIFQWTSGQPFLTQKLCKLIAQTSDFIGNGCEKAFVEQVVCSRIIKDWQNQDQPEHLTTIQDRILRSRQRSIQLLKLYRKILDKGKIPATQSVEQQEFLLSGLIRKRHGDLYVCCSIHEKVFDIAWVKQMLQDLRSHPIGVDNRSNSHTNNQSDNLSMPQILHY